MELIHLVRGIWGLYMAANYGKFWKLLIDKKMNKSQLCEKAKISAHAMARLGKNGDVRVEVPARICLKLGCLIDKIMEILLEKSEKEDAIWI